MDIDRRHFIALLSASTATLALPNTPAAARPTAELGLDATNFGLRPGSPDDQSGVLQRAIEETARTRAPLALAPGVYRVGNLRLAPGTQLVGTRGATRLVLTQGPSLVWGAGADHVTLSGLTLDGGSLPLPQQRGLVQLERCEALKIADCELKGSGQNGLVCAASGGEVIDSVFADTADAAIHALDSTGLLIARNRISIAGNNGIQVWRSMEGDDGSMVVDNRIDKVANRAGGSGQYGNGINVFRAANVLVRGNRIDSCAFSAVRGNAASNLHVEGNGITDAGEVALYAEFGFEGAVVANNSIDRAAIGISITNFNAGGRLAVVQGNIIRNLLAKRPVGTDPGDSAGVGIAVEADTAVAGNIVENAPTAGIMLGWGNYLRDVAVSGNVVRKADIGIAVSVVPGAGTALIANNLISQTLRGAIVGMARSQAVTGDLSRDGVGQFAHITLSGNRVR
jgi:uncharacterized secreted repeat protein (TIGR03808 family)